MGSQSDKKTLNSLDQAKFLGQSTLTQMPLVSSELIGTYSVLPPILDGEGNARTMDWDLFQQSNLGLLDVASRDVHELSQIYRMELVRLSELRRLRGDGTGSLALRFTGLRSTFLGSYDVRLAALMGLETPKSRTYIAVRERCEDAVRRMRNPELLAKLGARRAGSPELGFAALAQGLEDALRAYDDLAADVQEAVKLRDEALVAKKESLKRHRRVYVNVARVQEGLYRLAGLDELADLIRATIRVRKPRLVADPASGEEPVTEPTP